MATRRNLCLNPALDVDTTGWSGGSAPTRVTVSGFDRANAAEYTTSGSYCSTAATATNAVTVGLSYTLSIYARTSVFNVNSGTLFVEWVNGSGGGFGYPSSGFTMTANTVTRLSITATAPSGAVAARLIVDGVNFSINPADFTMALIEESADLGAYFDGNTAGAAWDGTPGLSSSTLTTDGTTTVSSSDTSSTAETTSLTASLPATDTANTGETTSLAATASAADAGTAIDAAFVGLEYTEAAVASDAAFLAAAASTTDLAVATETATVTVLITTTDTGKITDAAYALPPGAASQLAHLGGALLDTGVLGGSLI
ncbi:hypothetical protein ACFYY8_31540 [Streptosporangium sp. NPDC001559]|uniref:hypothetical protein n=1 Tax=Streptosporangium sp. NPDC001559 TaxID=3366187 RepID=UPI0036E66563